MHNDSTSPERAPPSTYTPGEFALLRRANGGNVHGHIVCKGAALGAHHHLVDDGLLQPSRLGHVLAHQLRACQFCKILASPGRPYVAEGLRELPLPSR